MSIVVRGEFADGAVVALRTQFSDLLDAVGYALETANHWGVQVGRHADRPVAIEVVEDGIVHLAIKVFPGGLSPR